MYIYKSVPEQKHETLRESAEVVVPIDRRKLIQVDCAKHLHDVTGSRGQDGGVRRKTRKRQTGTRGRIAAAPSE